MSMSKKWSRAVILVDMNAFFASVEQLDHPKWQGHPVAVTNGAEGSCIITCSYEARRFGIKTGMRLREARQRCPLLIHAPSRPARYAKVSQKIMQALQSITPDIEIFSIDEAFLDVTHCQYLYDPITAAKKVKQLVYAVSGLQCSVGVSGDKTTAKYAAQCQKPDGFTVIYPWEAKSRLANVPVTDLCGIAKGVATFLARYGVFVCGDMEKLPIGILAKRFGNLGRRLWYMCQGGDPDPVHTTVALPKSMGHSKILPPGMSDAELILRYFSHLSERLATRLRASQMTAKIFFIGMNTLDWGWIGEKVKLICDTNDGHTIFRYCQQLLKAYPLYGIVRQVQITALDPRRGQQQLDLFARYHDYEQNDDLNNVKDMINKTFGDAAVMSARVLSHKSTQVISPAWRPNGPRQTIKGK